MSGGLGWRTLRSAGSRPSEASPPLRPVRKWAIPECGCRWATVTEDPGLPARAPGNLGMVPALPRRRAAEPDRRYAAIRGSGAAFRGLRSSSMGALRRALRAGRARPRHRSVDIRRAAKRAEQPLSPRARAGACATPAFASVILCSAL